MFVLCETLLPCIVVVVVISILYTYACILRYSFPFARRQTPTLFTSSYCSPPYFKYGRYRNVTLTVFCHLLYEYSTHTVLYYFLRYAFPSPKRQRLLPLPPRNVTVTVLIAAAYQRTFNNRELFLLLFTTNLFGLAIQRRVSSKEVNGAGILTTKKRFDPFVDTVGERSNLREHGLMTNCYL